jgi:hypothetical protein
MTCEQDLHRWFMFIGLPTLLLSAGFCVGMAIYGTLLLVRRYRMIRRSKRRGQ